MQIKTEKAQQWLFLAAFFLSFWMQCAIMMQMSYVLPLGLEEWEGLYYVVMGLAWCAILLRGWTVLDLVLFAVSLFTYFPGDFNEFGILMLLLVVARGLDQRWLVQVWFGMHLVVLALCTVLYPIFYRLGSYHATVLVAPTNGGIRYNFFYTHCNGFGMTVAFCALAFVFLYYGKSRIRYALSNLVLLGAGALCWFGPKCKTAAVILAFSMILLALYRFLPRLFQFGMWVGLPAVLALAFGLVLGYYWGIIPPDKEILSAGTFTARFVDAAVMMKLYPLTLFGQGIYELEQFVEIDQFARLTCFDFGLLRIVVRFGVFGAVTFYGAVFAAIYRVLKRREWLKAMMIILMILYCTMEWIPFTTMFPLLFANDVLDFRRGPFLRYGRYGIRAQAAGPLGPAGR